MKFDFDIKKDRRKTNSLKWNVGRLELPMWVADMDFQTAPCIIEALKRKIDIGIFGYSIVDDAWFEAIINWWEKKHDFLISKNWLIFTTGVVPAVTCAVKRMTNTGDNVLVQTPVYDIFFHSIENHGRHVIENRLKYDSGKYSIDFEELEKELSNPITTMMILCNPHNPIGKVWSFNELEKIGVLCQKHHVVVLADEIHCDLTDKGHEYIPFASVSKECRENSIVCMSATKTFNIAGIQTAIVMIPNESIRFKMERGLNSDEVAEPNSFAIDAVVAGLNKGDEWLEELKDYLWDNKMKVKSYIENNIAKIHLVESNATYLLWMDCSEITNDAVRLSESIRRDTGLYLSAGTHYRGNGNCFLRMNIACQKNILEDGLLRLRRGVLSYERNKRL